MVIINGSSPSAQVLRDVIGDLTRTGDFPQTRSLVINWGARFANHIPDGGRVLNNCMRLNGTQQLDKLTYNNIACPLFCTNVNDAKINVRNGYKVWGRKLWHTQGYDIIGAGYRPATRRHPERFNAKWLARDYWVIAIPAVNVVNEWRIHVFMGRVIARALKVQTEPPWRKLPVRSRNNGWTMIHTEPAPASVKNIACAAVKAVGYDFGAVDILDTHSGPIVLEVNSAPALRSDYTLDAYINAFSRCANNKWNKWRDKVFTDGEPEQN